MKVADSILNLVPYVPGKPIEETKREFGVEHVIKLASNENPIGPSPKAIKAIQASLSELHRYPDPICYSLKQKLSKDLGYKENEMAIGNGSDELLDLLIKVYASKGGRVLMFASSFVAYKIAAQSFCVEVDEAPIGPDFEMDMDVLWKHYSPENHRLIFLVNPNNPTGRYIPFAKIVEFLKKIGKSTDTLLVVDEAYVEFPRAKDYGSMLNQVKEYPNLVILRTLSKAYGLAGLRLGFMVANPKVVDYIDRVRKPFNVNTMAQWGAIAALDDQDHVQKTLKMTWSGMDYVTSELTIMGIKWTPSEANFVLFDTGLDSQAVFQNLLKKGVIVRPVRNYGLMRHLRMSLGTAEENSTAIGALKSVLKEMKSSRNS